MDQVGATGGGYVLSLGVTTKATLDDSLHGLRFVVDGDPRYNARTSRRAVELLLDAHGLRRPSLFIEQKMDVPVGSGFGASAAAAISAVYAVASTLGIGGTKASLAYHAHSAEIIEQTGLGTVSVAYGWTGAGAITRAGRPGAAEFKKVRVPTQTRLVTATLGPYEKKVVLSDPVTSAKVSRLGGASLRRFLSEPSLETLAEEGERFSDRLGLMSKEVRALAELARSAGALHASQNMIGHAIHAVVAAGKAEAVMRALRSSQMRPRVDVFEVGRRKAGVIRRRSSSRQSRALS